VEEKEEEEKYGDDDDDDNNMGALLVPRATGNDTKVFGGNILNEGNTMCLKIN